MFVSPILVAIHYKDSFDPFPSAATEGVTFQYFTDFEAFIKVQAQIYIDCCFENHAEDAARLAKLGPAPVLVNAVALSGLDFTGQIFRFNGWKGFGYRPILELAKQEAGTPEIIKRFAGACGLECVELPDEPGFIRPRVVSMIINEACHLLEEGGASAQDIDTAMKLGTNYPMGPFEWAEKIGWENILRLLLQLAKTDSKYQPAAGLVAAANRNIWRKS